MNNQKKPLFFAIPGRLGAWQRAGQNRSRGITFTPKEMRSDQATIRHYAWLAMKAQGCPRLEGALLLDVIVFRTVPKSWSAKRRAAAHWITTKPDFDNHIKIIADALCHLAYDDDAQIADARIRKHYCDQESVTVFLRELTAEDSGEPVDDDEEEMSL